MKLSEHINNIACRYCEEDPQQCGFFDKRKQRPKCCGGGSVPARIRSLSLLTAPVHSAWCYAPYFQLFLLKELFVCLCNSSAQGRQRREGKPIPKFKVVTVVFFFKPHCHVGRHFETSFLLETAFWFCSSELLMVSSSAFCSGEKIALELK